MEDDQTFRLEEFKALRKEVEIYLTESRSQERYTLIAVGAVWAWLITNHIQDSLMWSIPFVLTVGTTLRMAAILRHFTNMGNYIQWLERKFKVVGWEHRRPDRGWTLGFAYIVLDLLLLVLTGVAWCHRCHLASLIPRAIAPAVHMLSS